jgi:hypothetical protein
MTLKTLPAMPDQEAVVNVMADGAGEPKASVTLAGADKLLDVYDPLVGDVVKVLPTIRPGVGLSTAKHFPEFSLLASVQGLRLSRWPIAKGHSTERYPDHYQRGGFVPLAATFWPTPLIQRNKASGQATRGTKPLPPISCWILRHGNNWVSIKALVRRAMRWKPM